ncbi:MAG TPA: LysR family transcriptional regulator [Candidatus Competibacter sp.]|nr:LysR family transcriptional regulator [Candidatus Competibacteraceae bacterium]HRW67598.1 LysR family transcriptional regulator [Candidatus Competibacter sp.]
MHVTLKQLRVFVSITQAGTLTAAAERLNLTKPAISMALRELESHLGHPLFDRFRNRLLLNAYGEQLLPWADELLTREAMLPRVLDDPLAGGTLTIGASRTVGTYLLPALIAAFRKETGHRDQRVWISHTAAVCTALTRFELDLGLVEGEVAQQALEPSPWLDDPLCVLAPVGHALAGRGVLELAELEGEAWLIREPGSGSREQFFALIGSRLRYCPVSLELNSTEALLQAVAAGLGLACLSRLAAADALAHGRVKELPLAIPLDRCFHIVLHRDKYRGPLLERFIQHCQSFSLPVR